MFKRVGKEIKTWAKVLVILGMIPVVIGSAIGAFVLIDEGGINPIISILGAIIAIALGYFLLRLCNMMLYSWGELVDRATMIDEKLDKLMARPVPAAPAVPPYAPPAPARPVPAPAKPVPTPVAPVKTAPVVIAPVESASVPKFDAPLPEDEYTHAAVSRPKPAPAAPAAATWTCPSCGQVNNADGNWCRNCGTKKSI